MKYLIFKLTMPNPPSWNGHWSGENEKHTRARDFTDDEFAALPKSVIGTHFWHWDDGWTARIDVSVTDDSRSKKRALNNSVGFCGYDWMIEEILKFGTIKNFPD